MRVTSSLALAGLVLATSAAADISIKIPSVTITDNGLADTAEGTVKGVSGIGTYVSGATPSSNALLSLFGTGPDAGAVRLKYSITNGAGAYSAATGILVPITAAWSVYDLSDADSVYFDIRTDAVGTNVNFLIGSPLTEKFGNASAALQTNTDQAGTALGSLKLTTTNWKHVGISLADNMVISPWYTEGDGSTDLIAVGSKWVGATPPGLSIGTQVKNLQFQPNWKWNSTGSAMTNGTGTIYVKNIVIKKASLLKWTNGAGCTGTFFQLDKFAADKAKTQNTMLGYWFAFSDTSSDPLKAADLARGMSAVTATFTADGAKLVSTLEKNVTGGTPLYRPYGGWTSLGTNFGNNLLDNLAEVDFPGIKAVSFDFYTGTNAGATAWDADKVPYVTFKVGKAGVTDDVAYSIQVPVTKGDGSNICVDLSALTQPSYYLNAKPWSPEGIKQMVWEVKIDDQKDVSLHTSGPNTMVIANVKVYGLDSLTAVTAVTTAQGGTGAVKSFHRASGFQATYNQGVVVSFNLPGSSAKVEVVRLDGSKVAVVNTAATVRNFKLPAVSLDRGTYLVVVRGQGTQAVVTPISVVR